MLLVCICLYQCYLAVGLGAVFHSPLLAGSNHTVWTAGCILFMHPPEFGVCFLLSASTNSVIVGILYVCPSGLIEFLNSCSLRITRPMDACQPDFSKCGQSIFSDGYAALC